MCMQDFKRCPVESASPVCESSPQNTLGHKKFLFAYIISQYRSFVSQYVIYVHVVQHYCNATYMHCIKKYYNVII